MNNLTRISILLTLTISPQFTNALIDRIRMRDVSYDGSSNPSEGDIFSWHGSLVNRYGKDSGSSFGYCVLASPKIQECTQTIRMDTDDEKGDLFLTFVDTKDNDGNEFEAAITGGSGDFQSVIGIANVIPIDRFGNYDYDFVFKSD